ncbi:hypothetical protein MKW98_007432 [Papaver atlanticum]|uniref:Uncharacterized protein n=1 Tax=Papaver atlanticum TaxID=357466 RepID=A0AAD4SB75_9MAGN|nr:hypothetical protein MKW98_007432 [Papaver atlanticum]
MDTVQDLTSLLLERLSTLQKLYQLHQNSACALVVAICVAKVAQKNDSKETEETVYEYVRNQNKPDLAYTIEWAKKSRKANACSGKIFVTVPQDHFGPIRP